MEDDLNFLANGRQPKPFDKSKMTSIFDKWKTAYIFWQMGDDLNNLANGKQPQYFGK
jgi:hypothetical protein